MRTVSHRSDGLRVVFDEPSLVANAGLVTVDTLVSRLGLERLVGGSVDLGGRPGAANAGEKFLTLVHSLVAGGSCIDDVDMLRAGDSGVVLSHRVVAPSTLGTFLRAFGLGNQAQLNRVFSEALGRAWSVGAGPGSDRLVVDLDSTVCEVFGRGKQGAAYHYSGKWAYHPLVASRADTGEIVSIRLRKGSSQRGASHFAEELIYRLRRAGARGDIRFRADSGFWSREFIDTLEDHNDVDYSITTKTNSRIEAAISAIPEGVWTPTDSSDGEEAEVAETTYVSKGATGAGHAEKTFRLIVRRTRTTREKKAEGEGEAHQASLFPLWRHHSFVTNRTDPDPVVIDREHRQHATVELAIKDLKEGAGLSRVPSGKFWANTAWLTAVALAHNLIRWASLLGGLQRPGQLIVARTFRTQLVSVPGRLVNHAGQFILRLPKDWPWEQPFLRLLARLRAIPLLI